jgi:hypothetical protein
MGKKVVTVFCGLGPPLEKAGVLIVPGDYYSAREFTFNNVDHVFWNIGRSVTFSSSYITKALIMVMVNLN